MNKVRVTVLPNLHRRTQATVTRLVGQLGKHGVLLLLGVVFFSPFAWMLSTSLKPPDQIFVVPPVWIPEPIIWSNYPDSLTYIPFFLYLKNTVSICIFNVLGQAISCSLVAYSFARIRWWGRNALFLMALSTMMLPFQVTMVPLFIVFKTLGWTNTYNPLVVPAFFGGAFYIFLLRQFFMTIPTELSDAARIDGASEFGIYRRIILPLAKPALASVMLFTFLANWNDFLGPLIYLSDQDKFTLSLGLQGFVSAHDTAWGMLLAASTVMTLPTIILFFFTQKTFVQGISVTGLKE